MVRTNAMVVFPPRSPSTASTHTGHFKPRTLALRLALVLWSVGVHAQVAAPAPILPDAIKWASPPTLPGVQTAWVLGAPDKPGAYLLRGKIATGARIPPHTHPEERNGTVLSGTIYLGFSATFDESKAIAIPAGGVWVAPANVPHFLWAKDGEVVFQCAGNGPSGTNFIKP